MFYGWIVFLILCFNYVFVVGCVYYSYGSLLMPMATELGMTITQTAFVRMVYTLATALLSLAVGQMLGKRFKGRTVLLYASASGVIGGLLMAKVVNSYALYAFCYIVLVMPVNLAGSGVVSQVLLTNWFVRRRNTVIAALTSMGGVAGFIFPPLTAFLTLHTGTWRSSWLLSAGGCAVAFVLTFLFIREKPADVGLEPYGAGETVGKKARREAGYITKASFTQKEAVRTPFLYLCMFIHLAAMYGGTIMSSYFVAHMSQQGVSTMVAASAVSIFAFCNIWGRVVSGMIQDKHDPKTIVKIVFPLMGAMLVALPYVKATAAVYAFGLAFGMCFSMVFTCPFSILMNTYGLENYGKIFSFENAGYIILGSLAALLPGISFDNTGSYMPYFYVCAALYFVTTALLCIIRIPKKEVA